MDEARLLRITEVADLLRISRTKVYELVASGEIPSLHVGRSRRVPLRALRDWIDTHTERRTVPELPAPAPVPRRISTRATPAPQTTRAAHPRPINETRTPQKTAAKWPFFKPWMPHPMEEAEYKAWVAHLDAHPDEKARVIDAMERDDASRR